MKEVELNYVFDLERVINKANKIGINKKSEEDSREANYILDTLGEKIGIDIKIIKKSKIKTVEILKENTKKINEPRVKKRRVIKYFIMTEKERINIIKQVTVSIKTTRLKEIFRDIKIFEEEDLIRFGYITKEKQLNYNHPIVKKLIHKKKN